MDGTWDRMLKYFKCLIIFFPSRFHDDIRNSINGILWHKFSVFKMFFFEFMKYCIFLNNNKMEKWEYWKWENANKKKWEIEKMRRWEYRR